MKKVVLSFIITMLCIISIAQVPESFNYQAIPRNSSGGEYPSQAMKVRINILSGSPTGSSVYCETFAQTTTSLGLLNLQIGKGIPVSGNFTTINWGANTFYLKVEIDPTGGTSYVEMGTTQLLSVPYAMYAKTVASYSETDPVFAAWNRSTGINITASQVSDFQTSVTNNSSVLLNTAKNSYPTADAAKVANLSGTNTGDETTTTIKTKLGVITLSGSNTGDQDISAMVHTNRTALDAVSGINSGDQTLSGLGGIAGNTAITGATKTKITYDEKGLVTTGENATTADIAPSTNKNYVTDAQLTIIGNTSGTNTGDETDVTIKTKLGITTISGSNTGDQTLAGMGGVAGNIAITGATKTKITYDTKGLVTAGTDATTADIAASTDKNYVTDAQLIKINNTSGINTGDQDLSSLATKTELTTGLDLKVDKVAGKGLSTNDYTNADKTKLDAHKVGTAAGQMYYWNGSEWITVPPGTTGQVLTYKDGVPTWTWTQTSEAGSVMNAYTGKIWQDRNLGASRVALSYNDAKSYGDFYQWGRGTDGHQLRSSTTSNTLSGSDSPGHGNFIIAPNSPWDWRTPQNNNLWQGVNGINNPCPSGFSIPSEAELDLERLSWSSNDRTGAFASPLKLPSAGYRSFTNGVISSAGSAGNYWSSTKITLQASRLNFGSSSAEMAGEYRAYGFSIRCIKGDSDGSEVLNPSTGKIWMDRNLGATQVATSSTDEASYGDLYQWGRGTDGHQLRTSGTTTTLSITDLPGHANFILAPDSPYDWRSSQNDNLWQGLSGTNNPCPIGSRLPTEAEWEAERLTWSTNNAAGAFASPLKLPVAGGRLYRDGSLILVGSFGVYWSSTIDVTESHSLAFRSSDAFLGNDVRAGGFSVRCIKDY